MATVRRRSMRLSSISKVATEEENNCNVMNRVLNNTNNHKTKSPPKTPERKSLLLLRPMPASKKREAAQKLQELESVNDVDEDNNEIIPNTTIVSSVISCAVSPPKQAKKSLAKQVATSPSQLITRLKLEDSPEANERPHRKDDGKTTPKRRIEDLPEPSWSKYQNARRVLNSNVADSLPGREKELEELHQFFREHIAHGTSASLYVSGQPGTGKTACLSLLLRSPEFKQSMQRVYINCTEIASAGSVYKTICTELGLTPSRSAGRSEKYQLAAIERHLCTTEKTVVIMLDEIDQLCTSRQTVLYTIFAWPMLIGARILLIGVANSLDLTDRVLQRLNAHCHMKPRLMHFAPYTKQQIVEIFKSRLEQAGVSDVFPVVALQLLAAKVSAVSGDVRRALDIGRRVVELAEQQQEKQDAQQKGSSLIDVSKIESQLAGEFLEQQTKEPPPPPRQEAVAIKEVAAVLNTVYGAAQSLQDDIESSFPLQQKLLLAALMLLLRHERHKDISMSRLFDIYRRVCIKRNIHSLDQTEFAGMVDLVETRGILRVLRKKETRLNKLQLQWDEEEVHAALQDKQLIASIIDDKSCLKNT